MNKKVKKIYMNYGISLKKYLCIIGVPGEDWRKEQEAYLKK